MSIFDHYSKNQKICDCEECQSGIYDPQDYMLTEEDFLHLDQERPIGITGHLRVKNSALTVGACIDSCIEFLDELIITYNTSIDNTEEILKKYAIKYSDKIRLFYYKPTVGFYYEGITQKEFKNTNSIHNLSNYYNFGYTKISYSHYMKIDADQIYFTKKILKLKSALVSPIPSFLKSILFQKLRNLIHRFPKIKKKLLVYCEKLSVKLFLYINRWLVNSTVTFSGINLFLNKNNKGLFFRTEITSGDSSTFNGFHGDTLLFQPSTNCFYMQYPTVDYESIQGDFHNIISIGLLWLHLQVLVKNSSRCYLDNKESALPIKMISKTSVKDFKILSNKDESFCLQNTLLTSFWNQDKKYVTDKFLTKYIDPILDEYQKTL